MPLRTHLDRTTDGAAAGDAMPELREPDESRAMRAGTERIAEDGREGVTPGAR